MSGHGEEILGKAYDARLIARLWKYVRPHWSILTIATLLIPLALAFELAQPFLLKIAIDDHIAVHHTDGLGLVGLGFLACAVLQSAASLAQLYTLQLVGQRSMHDLRQETYLHVITRRAAFYDRVPVGRLLTRMTSDIDSINDMFTNGVVTLGIDFIKLAGILTAMFYLDVRLTLITLVSAPAVLALVGWARRIMRASFREIRVKVAAMTAFVAERLGGLRVVQLFRRERAAASEYDQIGDAHRRAWFGAIKSDATMYAVVEALGLGVAAAIAWHAGGNIGRTGLTVGLVVAFIEYVNRLFAPIKDLSAKYGVMQSAMAASERIVELLDTDEQDAPVDPAHGDRTEQIGAPAIELRDVRFSYRNREQVLQGVDLQVDAGTTVAVVGATGSGKSTLIRLVSRLYEPDAGQVLIRGRNIATWHASELRARLAVVSQDVFLFAGTVADNVRLGRLDATRDEVDQALARIGADKALARRDATADSAVAERGGNFSAGERQLIVFARALIRNPEILILDEATANVDPETEAAIEQGVRVLMEGRTTLIIAHRLSTIRKAHRIFVMDKGRIAEAGTHEELIAQGGMFAQLERTFQRA